MDTLDFFTIAGILLAVYAVLEAFVILVNKGHRWKINSAMTSRYCPRCTARQSLLYQVGGRVEEWEDMNGAGGSGWCRKQKVLQGHA